MSLIMFIYIHRCITGTTNIVGVVGQERMKKRIHALDYGGG